jgi:hypothetical protein
MREDSRDQVHNIVKEEVPIIIKDRHMTRALLPRILLSRKPWYNYKLRPYSYEKEIIKRPKEDYLTFPQIVELFQEKTGVPVDLSKIRDKDFSNNKYPTDMLFLNKDQIVSKRLLQFILDILMESVSPNAFLREDESLKDIGGFDEDKEENESKTIINNYIYYLTLDNSKITLNFCVIRELEKDTQN